MECESPDEGGGGGGGDSAATAKGKRLYGKYKGEVVNNIDPLGIGRINVLVPQTFPGSLAGWAMPCFPYGGLNRGFFMVPEVGAMVWIEFEGGNRDRMIWTGCFFNNPLEFPEPLIEGLGISPLIKKLKTIGGEFTIDDKPGVGGIKLEVNPPSVPLPVSLKFDASGATLSVGPASSIKVSAKGIELNAPTVTIKGVASVAVEGTATASLKGGAVSVEGTATTAVKGAAVTVEGTAATDVKCAGAVNVQGTAVKISGASINLTP